MQCHRYVFCNKMYDVFEGDIRDNIIKFIFKLYLQSANQHYDWTSLFHLESVIEKTQHSSLVGSQVPLLEFLFPLGLGRSHLWPRKSLLYIPLAGSQMLFFKFQSPSRLRRSHLWPCKSLYIRLIGPQMFLLKFQSPPRLRRLHS
jgi:hypothetical protein